MAKEDDNYKYPLLMKGTQSGRLIRMVAYGKVGDTFKMYYTTRAFDPSFNGFKMTR